MTEASSCTDTGCSGMEDFYFAVYCVCFGVVGLCIGSFLNVVVYRVPLGMNLAKPGSHCTTCNHPLSWKDNIPLLSFVFLGGKCRYCKAKISPRYFLVELCNCVMWLMCAFLWARNNVVFALMCASAISVLLCVALCDSDNMFIPDSLQIALGIVAVVAIFFDPYVNWLDKLLGFALGSGFMIFFYLLCFPLFGHEGLGIGDIKLAAGCGLLLGWKNMCVAIVVCIVFALVGVLVRKISLRKFANELPLADDGEFPFGPYIVLGVTTAMFFGDYIANLYISLLM